MQLQIVSESQINNSLDVAIKQILCICFPEEKDILSKINYWHSVPAWRVILKEDQELIGHVAIVDRTIRIGQSLARVAGGQGVSLLPEYRGKGLCDRMFEAVAAEALRQGFDFGMLFCYPAVETVYRRYDYRILADSPAQPT